MALPKKGLRKLEHESIEYGWLIRKKPTYSQAAFRLKMSLAIQSMATDTPQILHVTLNIERPDNWIEPHQTSVTPRVIKSIIDCAIEAGWVSDGGGKPYEFKYAVFKHS